VPSTRTARSRRWPSRPRIERSSWHNKHRPISPRASVKSAIAQVRLSAGEGRILVNERPLDEYFGRETSRMIVNQPFEVTEIQGRFDVTVNVRGGGVSAQASAIRTDLARVAHDRP